MGHNIQSDCGGTLKGRDTARTKTVIENKIIEQVNLLSI